MAFDEFDNNFKAILRTGFRTIQGDDVVIAGGQTTDYPSTGGKRAPPGLVVVKESGDGKYYLASGADGVSAGDINVAAVVTSIEAPDADWKNKTLTWSIFYPDGTKETGTVLGGAGDDTIAEWVTVLMADAQFKERFIATDSGAADLLVITSRAKGNVRIRMSMDLDTAFATDDGASSSDSARGTQADYRVITQHRDLVGLDGLTRDSEFVPTLLAGDFDTSELTGLTDEARAVLEARGSTFD